ncbi:MAG TPA: hypothetical protein VG276_00445 [Actinomycetes bacterium]|nr:hypothetical protein [Actinomycetes bacterium]
MRKALPALGVAVVLTLFGGPADAAPSLKVSPGVVHVGDKVSVAGRCPRNSSRNVTIEVAGKVIVQTRAGRNRRFSSKGRVPNAPGARAVRAECGSKLAGTGKVTIVRDPAFSVSPTTVEAGGTIRISGTGCLPKSKVNFFLDSFSRIGSTPADREGDFSKRVKLSKRLAVGRHQVTASCKGQTFGPVTITVRAKYPAADARSSTVAVSRSTVTAGRTVAISAPSCDNGTADASLDDQRLVLAAPVRQGGVYSANATIPSGTPAGTYRIVARCNGRVDGAATVRVVAADQLLPTNATGLPSQRTNILPGLGAGLALIIAGGLVLLGIKRRRSRRFI